MSDIIDAAAQPTTRLRGIPVIETSTADLRVPARDYVRLAQGFYFVFWGLLVTVLTAAQLFMARDIPPFAELFLGGGVLSTLIGSWRLYQVRSLGEPWHGRMGVAFVLAGLMAYFCVFFYLWQRTPDSLYLLGNVLAFGATGIVYVVAFNRAVTTLATRFSGRDMAFESRVSASGNVGLLLAPFACVVTYIIGIAFLRQTEPLAVLRFVLIHANFLIIVVLLLPFSLTLSLAWSCKDTVLRRLADLDHPRDLGSDRA